MVLATPAAFGFAKMKIKGSKHYEFWVLSTRMMPPIAALIPIFVIIRILGLFDTKAGIILPYIAFNLPYAVWMMTIFFRQLPDEIDEAAMLDGCTWSTIFFNFLWRIIFLGYLIIILHSCFTCFVFWCFYIRTIAILIRFIALCC